MPSFTGSNKATLEGGSRLRVPAGQRRSLEEKSRVKVGPVYVEDQVIGAPRVIRDPDLDPYGITCLAIYTAATFQRVVDRLGRSQHGTSAEEIRDAVDYLNTNFEDLTVGAGGRIELGDLTEILAVPEPWEVWVVGDGDRLLVMSPEDHQRRAAYFKRSQVVRGVNSLLRG